MSRKYERGWLYHCSSTTAHRISEGASTFGKIGVANSPTVSLVHNPNGYPRKLVV